jgi:hypothetical protein
MKSLDFMIIGAQKAGTTALSHFLAQHPAICMAEGKEVHLFDASEYSSDWSVERINAFYAPSFAQASECCQWGEATPIYLYRPDIIPELKRYNPHLKLIVMLRDPVERALSQYAMEYGRGNDSLPLWLALLLEPVRLRYARGRRKDAAVRCYSYSDRGVYDIQLRRLNEYFSPGQILIVENATLRSDHAGTLAKIFAFLGVDDQVSIPSEQIFRGDYPSDEKSIGRQLLKKCLALRFYWANRRLKKTLLQMGYSPDWPWLR